MTLPVTEPDVAGGDPFELVDAAVLALGTERVAIFSVRRADTRRDLRLAAMDLVTAVGALPSSVAVIAFVDAPAVEDPSIRRMITEFADRPCDAMIRLVPATEAVKRIDAGVIAETIDRSTVGSLRAPEVLDREALARALGTGATSQLVDPTSLVAANGGRVTVFEADRSNRG